MRPVRVVFTLALLLGASSARGQGSYRDSCEGGPLETRSILPGRQLRAVYLRTPEGPSQADNYDPPRLGSLDATVSLTEVAPSRTQHHEVHGHLDATGVATTARAEAGSTQFALHAEF